MFMKKILLCCLLTSVLAACGGGHGDGGSDGIEFSPSSLSFTGTQGQAISAKTVSVNVGTSSTRRYVGIDNKTPQFATATYAITHVLDAFSITITPVNGLIKGTYNGTVDALVCNDPACRDVADRGTLHYTITIN
jgi:hypothetical protein